ncbi:MAG: hypothetical protein LBE91_01960 [Tannerella sp.]|jgi:hypothetical protein|nr:hypothetical protein [Tannerella sp.]
MATRNFLERALTGENQWWKYLLIILAGFVGGAAIGLLPALIISLLRQIHNLYNYSSNFLLGMTIPAMLIALILTVIFIRAFHDRTFPEIINGTKSVRWNRTYFAFAVGFTLMVIWGTIDHFWHCDNCIFQPRWGKLTVLLVLSVVYAAMEGTTIELLIHGYIAQGIGAGTHSRWWALIIPAIIWGLWDITYSGFGEPGFWLLTGQSLFLGLLLGLIAILDDGIELSIGLFTADELFSHFFRAPSEELMDSIFAGKTTDPFWELISTVIIGLIAFIIFYKKYRWNFRIMNERVGKPSSASPSLQD